jgi:hypothetical protein
MSHNSLFAEEVLKERLGPMGSIKYRKPRDRVVLANIRETFHDIMGELDPLGTSTLRAQRLQGAIIEELIDLASDGTPQDAWKASVLRRLPLR